MIKCNFLNNFDGTYTLSKQRGRKMKDNCLLNPKEFKIYDKSFEDGTKGSIYCKKLIEKWTPQLEREMLEAFIHLYYDDMYKNWGPDDEEESKEYWPEIHSPVDLIKYTGTDVTLYALEDAVYGYGKDKTETSYGLQAHICVVLQLNCPWEEEHGWAAVFIDEKFVKVAIDIVDCVWLD